MRSHCLQFSPRWSKPDSPTAPDSGTPFGHRSPPTLSRFSRRTAISSYMLICCAYLCLRLWHYAQYVPHYGSLHITTDLDTGLSCDMESCWVMLSVPSLGPVLLLGILWVRRLACNGQGVDVRCNPGGSDCKTTLECTMIINDLHGTKMNQTCKTESQSSGLFRHGGGGWGIGVWTSFGCRGSLSGCIRLLAWRLKIYQGSRLSCLTDVRTRIRSDEALSNRQSRLVAIDYAESQVQGFKVVVVHWSVNLVREEFWGGEFLKFCLSKLKKWNDLLDGTVHMKSYESQQDHGN